MLWAAECVRVRSAAQRSAKAIETVQRRAPASRRRGSERQIKKVRATQRRRDERLCQIGFRQHESDLTLFLAWRAARHSAPSVPLFFCSISRRRELPCKQRFLFLRLFFSHLLFSQSVSLRHAQHGADQSLLAWLRSRPLAAWLCCRRCPVRLPRARCSASQRVDAFIALHFEFRVSSVEFRVGARRVLKHRRMRIRIRSARNCSSARARSAAQSTRVTRRGPA